MTVKIGLALGGGGARGLAHLGALKVLEAEGIPIACITGTSAGAVVGAMYAQNPDADALIERFKKSLAEEFFDQLSTSCLRDNCVENDSFLSQTTRYIKKRIVINLAQSRRSLLKEFSLQDVLVKFIDEGRIEATKIPLAIVATGLHTGREIWFESGDIIAAVAASSTIPGFFPPVYMNDDLVTDGAATCPLPVQRLSKMGADVTLGVEVGMRYYHPLESINAIEIISRANMITSHRLGEIMVNTADVAIQPDTKDVHWSEFSRCDELIEAGMKATVAKLPQIRTAIRRRVSWPRRVLDFMARLQTKTWHLLPNPFQINP
jgi:NTE family protein